MVVDDSDIQANGCNCDICNPKSESDGCDCEVCNPKTDSDDE